MEEVKMLPNAFLRPALIKYQSGKEKDEKEKPNETTDHLCYKHRCNNSKTNFRKLNNI